MVEVTSSSGGFKKTKSFLESILKIDYDSVLKRVADDGLKALSMATPRKTGKTAESWSYEIEKTNGKITVYFNNSNIVNYVNIAIILQYGHGTKNGGYVAGRDYINPALKPIFDKMSKDMWEVVVSK